MGYKLIVDNEMLKTYTNYNNVVDTIGGLQDNNEIMHNNNVESAIGGLHNKNVTLKLLLSISNLGMTFKQMYKKMLF